MAGVISSLEPGRPEGLSGRMTAAETVRLCCDFGSHHEELGACQQEPAVRYQTD